MNVVVFLLSLLLVSNVYAQTNEELPVKDKTYELILAKIC